MESTVRVTKVEWFWSSCHPKIETSDPLMREVIVWGDKNPVAWDIVMSKGKSVWSADGHEYLGCLRVRSDADSVLGRLALFKEYTKREDSFGEAARFTLKHFGDRGFTPGFFQQWARYTSSRGREHKAYPRGCQYLDYTPETKEAVLDRFEKWALDHWSKEMVGPTEYLTIDNQTVRIYPDFDKAVKKKNSKPVKRNVKKRGTRTV